VRPGILESFGDERGIWNGDPSKNTSRQRRHLEKQNYWVNADG
jgi:hypothetical protein